MIKSSLFIVLAGLLCAVPGRCDDDASQDNPPDSSTEARQPDARQSETRQTEVQGGSIGGAGHSLSGVGVERGQGDHAAASGQRAASGSGGGGGEGLNVANDDSCNRLPAQKTTTKLREALRLKDAIRISAGPKDDAIDLHTVTFVKGVSIADWAITSTIKDVKTDGQLCIDHTMLGAESWRAQFFDDKDTKVEGNQWVFAFIKGRWYGGAGEWIRPGQLCKAVEPANVGCGVFYDSSPLKTWRPAHGELVGIAVSAPARAGQWSVAERSNVVLVPWP